MLSNQNAQLTELHLVFCPCGLSLSAAIAAMQPRLFLTASDRPQVGLNPFRKASSFDLFQTLSSIAAEKNSTIIFPVPIDFISSMVGNGGGGGKNGDGGGAGAGSSLSATLDADTMKKEK